MSELSGMSDEMLSLKLAELLEPLSTLPSDDDMDEMKDFPSECWVATFRLSKVTGFHVPDWQPCDMVNDPAMTVMLLEKLITTRGFVSLSAWISSPKRVCITGQVNEGVWESDEPSTYAASEKLGRSVAESAYLALTARAVVGGV